MLAEVATNCEDPSMETEIIDGDLVRTGSTNVFADLGLPNPEGRLLKAQLMRAINAEIRRRVLTQEAAAALVDLKQPELSRIANGRGSGFSTDRLIEVVRHLGRDIEVVVSNASGPIGELRFRERA
jgi:predicted XRE-type DNA-binding protein